MSVIVIRTILLYALIVFSLRIMGKRQLGELEPSELVATILISNIATLPIENIDAPFLTGVIPILTLVCFEVLLSVISLKFKKFRTFVSGSPRTIIRDGIIDQKEMQNLRFSIDDLMSQLRTANIFDVRDVAFAIVETNGNLSVYQSFKAQTVTAEMLNLMPQSQNNSPPAIIISDGTISHDSLIYCNLTMDWLDKILIQNSCNSKDIFLMTCDRTADYHIVKKNKVGN